MVLQSLCRHTDILNSSFPFPPNFCFPPTPPPFPIEHLSLLTCLSSSPVCLAVIHWLLFLFFLLLVSCRVLTSTFTFCGHPVWGNTSLTFWTEQFVEGWNIFPLSRKDVVVSNILTRNTHRSFDWPTDVAMLGEADALEKLTSYIQSWVLWRVLYMSRTCKVLWSRLFVGTLTTIYRSFDVFAVKS